MASDKPSGLVADREDEESSSTDDSGDDWETESLIEQIFIEGEVEDASASGCTPAEAAAFRARLREIGPEAFIRETITAGTVTARKLCHAFGASLHILSFLDGAPDAAYYGILGQGIQRELARRQKLPQYNTLEDAADLLRSSSKIVVITGAGISTNLGIPDFRSKHTGFYSKLKEAGIEEPEEVFDIYRFDEDPSLAGDLLPEIGKTSPTHAFIRLLQDEGKLLTNYTQNIDDVESQAGIHSNKLIQCHGSWATATCRKCGHQVPGKDLYADVKLRNVSYCQRCEQTQKESLKRKRPSSGPKFKRQKSEDSDSSDDGRYDMPTAGVMKPDITFFGEKLPEDFFVRFKEKDCDAADMVIVIGTSMQVAPVSNIPGALPAHVPQIYISKDPIKHIEFDIDFYGDCDTICSELARRAGWNLQHPMLPTESRLEIKAYNEQVSKWTVQRVDTSETVSVPDVAELSKS